MKTVEIIGYKRANLGKEKAQHIRQEGQVPCVLYGMGKEPVHFSTPIILFTPLLYTNEAHFVNLDIEGQECRAILQASQFHPVSEVILHADFLRISDDKKVKMSIPVMLKGQAPGVAKGGTLVRKRPYLKIRALPKDMPDYIEVDVSELDFHHAVKVENLPENKLEYLDPKRASIAVVEVPRAAKIETEEDADKEGEEAVEEKDADQKDAPPETKKGNDKK